MYVHTLAINTMRLEDEIKQKQFNNEYHKMTVNVLYTSSWLTGLHSKLLKKYRISPQQFNILRILRGQYPNPATVNLLIERMLDKNSNASRLVEKLRLKGLVERGACPDDRRAVDVMITKKGLKMLNEIDLVTADAESQFKTLTKVEVKQLNDLLDKLRG